jgi:hypothetical protein
MVAALAAVALGCGDAPPASQDDGAATDPPAPPSIVEIRTYDLTPGRREDFHRLVVEESLPLLGRHEVDVIGYGPSAHDETTYVLIRAFDDLADRERSEEAFYGSAEWLEGPRDRILELIEGYTTVVLELDAATIAGLRSALAGAGTAAGEG